MMEFNTSGAIFTLHMIQHGVWTVRVPWEVAIEGWRRETGRDTSDKGDLRGWFDANFLRFTEMIAARIDPDHPPSEPDDPRVVATRNPEG